MTRAATLPPPATPAERRERAQLERRVFTRWLRGDSPNLSAAGWREEGAELCIPLGEPLPRLRAAQQRQQSVNVNTAGGWLIAELFADTIEIALSYYNTIRDVATIARTETGADWPLPAVNDTANEGQEVPENTLPPQTDITQFEQFVLHARKRSSGWLLLPVELVEDAHPLFMSWLAELIAARIGRGFNHNWTNQLVGVPTLGAQTPATIPVAVTTTSQTAIASDEVMSLLYSLDPAYFPRAEWMCHQNTLQYLRKLKDANGRYQFPVAVGPDGEELLLGRRVHLNQYMAGSVIAGATTLVCGQLDKIIVREVREVRIRRLEERYAEYDQVGLAGFLRADMQLADAGTAPIKALVQHS